MKIGFVFTFVFVITGAIIGAGFASGREVLSFFSQYGFLSLIFILFAGLLFYLVFYVFAKIGNKLKPNSISDLTKNIFGKASIIVDLVFILSSFITLSSMLAGVDSTMKIVFSEKYIFPIVSILTCFIVVLLLNYGIKKIFKFTDMVMPFLFGTILIFTLAFLLFGQKQQINYSSFNHSAFSLGISPILYVSMNTFCNIFLIAKAGSYMDNKKVKLGSIICASILTFCIFAVGLCILFGGDAILYSDMPMLVIAKSMGNLASSVYFVILIVAIFTTICTSAYTIVTWLNTFIANKFLCAVIVMTLGFIFSRFGFANIVDIFYPLEGAIGLIFIIMSIKYYFQNRNNNIANRKTNKKTSSK